MNYSKFSSITDSSWPCTPCWEFWWTWDQLIGKISSFLNQLLTSTFIASSSLNFILWCDIVTVSIAWSGSCFCSIAASHTASWPYTPCWEFWWTWDHLIGKISSFYNLQSPLLQISVSIRSLEVASEHIPPMQVLLLVFSPFPQVLLHSEYGSHVE